ncbi:MAG TPA: type IV pilus secretin PilQ [Candidatus Eisenbacteria bacterium]|nr:type IV pilus secretin PilQ [Candidatus Eisenbacteria bacterium]
MRALGRGFMLLVFAGCAAATIGSRGVAATLEEQPIAVPETEPGTPTQAAAVQDAQSLAIRDVRVEATTEGRKVVVALTRAPDGVRNFSLASPPRVVVDVAGPYADRIREKRYAMTDPVVSRVRVAPYAGQLRIVLDLKQKVEIRDVRQEGDTVVADLGNPATAAPKTARERATDETSQPVLAAMVETPAPAPQAAPAPKAEPAPKAAPTPEPTPMPEAGPIATPSPLPDRNRPQPIAYEPPAVPEAVRPQQPSRVVRKDSKDTLGPVVPTPVFHGEKISLDFKDADIQNVLRVLADVSGLNIIATDDVQGKVTLHLTDVPWDQAFDLVLRTNRLEKTEDGNVVRVSSVNRLKEERDSLKAAEDSENELEPLRVKYVRVNYARADESLVDKVKGVLTDRGAVTFDERTNTVIVRDIGRGVDDASHLIKELDVQSPQVLIEANIVEATQDFARGLGVQWGYQNQQGPSTGTPTGANFPGTIGVGGSGLGVGTAPPPSGTGAVPLPVPFLADFPVPTGFGNGFGAGSGSAIDLALGSLNGANTLSVRLTALENEGKAKVISRPRVITMNNVAATIQSLTILRVKLPSTGTVINTGAGGSAGGGTTATEKINTGITLVVTPQVSSDGFVLMSIYAKSSQPDFTRAVDGIPSEVSREANSNVLIRNGDTVVLGGIYRTIGDDREDGMPYLSKIPALGWLFKRTLESKHHEELIVFLTPKVVDAGTASLPPSNQLWAERRGG